MNESTAKTSLGEKIFIALMSILLAYCIFLGMTKSKALAKSAPAVETDSAETFLMLNDACDAIYGNVASIVQSPQAKKAPPGPDFLQGVNDSLIDDLKEDPHDPNILTKLIIVRIEKHLPAQKYFDELSKLDSDDAHKGALALEAAYGFRPPKNGETKRTQPENQQNPQQKSSAPEEARQADSIEHRLSGLPKGWYEKHARYVFEMRTGKKKEAAKILQQIDDDSIQFLIRLALMIASGALVTLVGVITILSQLFVLARRVTPAHDMPLLVAPVNYGWLTVYKVFLYWILATVVLTEILQLAAPKADGNPELVALFNLSSYVLSYSPGVFFIYWFALKPHGISFKEGIKLRMRVGKLGPGRMVLSGFLAWSAAVPVILVAYAIAMRFLHSHGSDNEIKDKILDAARTGDPIVIGSYFVMAGLIAPLIEESLFRGFLYTYLRRSWPVFPAMVVSALLFAGAHLDPGGFFPLFCLGAVFAFTVEKTKSIVPSIIAHSLWNSVCFVFSLLIAG
jgi:membrane protease YdiL (CAAX protease family)